jgi:hypothetical protein
MSIQQRHRTGGWLATVFHRGMRGCSCRLRPRCLQPGSVLVPGRNGPPGAAVTMPRRSWSTWRQHWRHMHRPMVKREPPGVYARSSSADTCCLWRASLRGPGALGARHTTAGPRGVLCGRGAHGRSVESQGKRATSQSLRLVFRAMISLMGRPRSSSARGWSRSSSRMGSSIRTPPIP